MYRNQKRKPIKNRNQQSFLQVSLSSLYWEKAKKIEPYFTVINRTPGLQNSLKLKVHNFNISSNLDLPHSLLFVHSFQVWISVLAISNTHKNNRKQAWSRVHASNTMGTILCLVPVPTVQILHPDSDIKSLSTFHGSLWGNKHGDPRFFFQVFPKNSLIKNIFEEEKKFDSRTWFFFGK